ncbi:MAG: EAL domain-containing protein [Pseudomonadota bacterium]
MGAIVSERTLMLRVGVGFVLVLLMMIASTAVGLLRLADANQRMRQIVDQANVSNELVYRMKDALRERAILMHSISLLKDRFDQEELLLKYSQYGSGFVEARTRLLTIATDAESLAVLDDMRKLTMEAQPLAAQALEMALRGKQAAAQELIRQRVSGVQNAILLNVSKLQRIQQERLGKAVEEVELGYRGTRLLMLVLGGVAGALGIGIAVFVLGNTRRQAGMLRHQAMYDALTDLPNRTLWADRLDWMLRLAAREKLSFAVLLIDLDRFKEINDTLGHAVGDEVLRQTASRWRTCLRESDTIARLGGDEFAVLLPTANTMDGAIEVARKIIQTMSTPVVIGQRNLDVSLSIGIALYPAHGENSEILQRRADSAMYVAKRTQSGYRVFSEDLSADEEGRLTMQSDLKRAIDAAEFFLHYQPKIDFEHSLVKGVEALVRWQHPEKGLIMPDRFIPLAEKTGLIKPLTNDILKMALKQCRAWQEAGLDLTVAVNISAISVQDPDFPDQIGRLLTQYQLHPNRLELEVTESAVMTDPARAIDCIRRLAETGILVSIDDFGTGYSSMTNLKDFMVAKIKIDRSFVKDMATRHSDDVIVRSTIELGHNLGLKVVAEGVEDKAAWERLKSLGCDSAQGYYMSRPLSPDAFLDWLNKSPWKASSSGT